MHRIISSAVIVALLLAGCTAPSIPEDAIAVTNPELEGGTMWAWLDTSTPNITRIHGHFDYAGQELLHTDECDPRGAWNLTIQDESGATIIFDPRPCRHSEYQPQSYNHKESFVFSWLEDEYERYQKGGSDEYLESTPVARGNYTITLQYLVAIPNLPDDAFEAVLVAEVQ